MQGNPNPSPATRFVKGQSANPGGKSSEQVSIERRNAAAALRIRERMLQAAEATLDNLDGDQIAKALEMIEPAMLKLLKDAEDRGLGAPVQDHRSSDGSMSPTGAHKLSEFLDVAKPSGSTEGAAES